MVSFPDRLAVVGGLAGFLVPFFSFFVLTFHYRSQYAYLMKELFVEPVSKEDDCLDKSKREK